MQKIIKRYINNYNIYYRYKPLHHRPYNHLYPLQLPRRHENFISMDFMINFLITKLKNDIIIIIMDRLFKITHFIPLRFGKGKADIIMVTKLLFDHIFKLYNLLKKIISDQDL